MRRTYKKADPATQETYLTTSMGTGFTMYGTDKVLDRIYVSLDETKFAGGEAYQTLDGLNRSIKSVQKAQEKLHPGFVLLGITMDDHPAVLFLRDPKPEEAAAYKKYVDKVAEAEEKKRTAQYAADMQNLVQLNAKYGDLNKVLPTAKAVVKEKVSARKGKK